MAWYLIEIKRAALTGTKDRMNVRGVARVGAHGWRLPFCHVTAWKGDAIICFISRYREISLSSIFA